MKACESIVKEFQQAFQKDYGKKISVSEASEVAGSLVEFFDLLAQINHREKIKNRYSHESNNNQHAK